MLDMGLEEDSVDEAGLSSAMSNMGISGADTPDTVPITAGAIDYRHVRQLRQRFAYLKGRLLESGGGIPGAAVPLVDPACIQSDRTVVDHSLPAMVQRDWHPAKRIPETADYIAEMPDVQPMVSPVTPHVPVMWFHTAQLQRAAAAGVHVPIAARPSPYGGLPDTPVHIRDISRDPRTWDLKCAWYQAMSTEIARALKGYRFRFSQIPGGKGGLHIDASWTRPEFARVPFENVGGFAVPRVPTLPDRFTEVRVGPMYALAAAEGASDNHGRRQRHGIIWHPCRNRIVGVHAAVP